MRRFAALYAELDETTSTTAKVEALARYFAAAPPADAAWALNMLVGRRPRRLIRSGLLRTWAAEAAAIPDWLFEESYHQVGDLAETVTLLVPDHGTTDDAPLAVWVEERLLALRGQPEDAQRAMVLEAWRVLGVRERFCFMKLITGEFRVGASAKLVTRALAATSGLPEEAIAHRLMGNWEPTPDFYARLLAPDVHDADESRPYPFCLAYPLDEEPAALGDLAAWQAEWKWDGIRAQVVRRGGSAFVWSRGEELMTGRFPEVEETARLLPEGTVLDGELLPWVGEQPLPFTEMQRRIGRTTLSRKVLTEVPVRLVTYDLLERDGADLRGEPLEARRAALAQLVHALPRGATITLSPIVAAADWVALAAMQREARRVGAEGLMLKRRASPYGVGRKRGDWWKWKVSPFTVDAVLIYAQPGHGRRAGLFTDYTFGVWDGDALVPFAKAYSGLSDEEIRAVDAFVRRNTVERFGPVRTVAPELVFELAFEGIQRSTRHKSGIAVRFPRMSRWRHDKRPADADTLETVRALIDTPAAGGEQ
ncbi:MAG TPA: ATP-dependent DNA ligase [Gemmatimonadales bacterium]|nr:ATP-dependent DNA ligase [Gemmatimonadales bacterium]